MTSSPRSLMDDDDEEQSEHHPHMFLGAGVQWCDLLGLGIVKIWAVPYEAISLLMVLVLSILTVFIAIQMLVCREEPYKPPPDAPVQSTRCSRAVAFVGVIGAFAAVFALVRRSPDPMVACTAAWAFNGTSAKFVGSQGPQRKAAPEIVMAMAVASVGVLCVFAAHFEL